MSDELCPRCREFECECEALEEEMNTFMGFNPNKAGKKPPEWATYVPSRRGASWKIHTSRGAALHAISYHSLGALYRWDGSKWLRVLLPK